MQTRSPAASSGKAADTPAGPLPMMITSKGGATSIASAPAQQRTYGRPGQPPEHFGSHCTGETARGTRRPSASRKAQQAASTLRTGLGDRRGAVQSPVELLL